MHKEWPTDNLLDDMANEYAEALYPNWDFRKYGIRNPWAFRLACKEALVIPDDGEPLLDPKRLVEAVSWFMRNEIRQKEGCLEDDEESEDEAEVRMKAIESFVREWIDNACLSEEEVKALEDPVMIERVKDYMLAEIHSTVSYSLSDAVRSAMSDEFPE